MSERLGVTLVEFKRSMQACFGASGVKKIGTWTALPGQGQHS